VILTSRNDHIVSEIGISIKTVLSRHLLVIDITLAQ